MELPAELRSSLRIPLNPEPKQPLPINASWHQDNAHLLVVVPDVKGRSALKKAQTLKAEGLGLSLASKSPIDRHYNE